MFVKASLLLADTDWSRPESGAVGCSIRLDISIAREGLRGRVSQKFVDQDYFIVLFVETYPKSVKYLTSQIEWEN